MKRTFVLVIATLAAAALFGGLVYAVLVAALYVVRNPDNLRHLARAAPHESGRG
jgi:hypothetical protein